MSAVSGVTIFMEGGGRGNKRALRSGMAVFLRPLREAARGKSLRFGVVPCGSREETYTRFRNAVSSAAPEEICILLVDAETSVSRPPRAHLRKTDGWDLDEVRESAVHLMAQIMETWIVADRAALAAYYGNNLTAAKLPVRANLEEEPKGQVLAALKEATRRTGKGAYQKINHAGALLKQIDPSVVSGRCQHCKRLFDELRQILEAA